MGGQKSLEGSRPLEVQQRAAQRAAFRVPRDSQKSITSVFDIYQHVRLLAGTVANVWGLSSAMTCLFRQVLPGLARVRVAGGVFVVQAYLLQDLEQMCIGAPCISSILSNGSTASVSEPLVQEVSLRHQTPNFRHVVLLLKLRWLLRLHSACCELDYKMCSLRSLIFGMQYVVLQQHSEMQTDSVFDSKVSQHIGSHLNLDSVLDDVTDQLQRALGASWKGFLEYVSTCDPSRSVCVSKMDSNLTPPQIVSNDNLSMVLDTIFLASFLRQPRRGGACGLKDLYFDLEMLGLRLPEVPPLYGAERLRVWAKAQTRPTRQDREQVYKKENEKVAQLEAVLLTASIELHLPEVFASEEDMVDVEEMANRTAAGQFRDGAPPPQTDGGVAGSSGPPAARVILADKPQLTPTLFEAALQCVHHHKTFPTGIRERLYDVLLDEYLLTQEQTEQLAVAVTQNIEGKRLPESVLYEIVQRERTRLNEYQANTLQITSHLLVPALVAAPIEKGKAPKYILSRAPPLGMLPAATFHSSSVGRSLPDLHSKLLDSREPFKVVLTGGPLTVDPDSRKLRSTGFFIKMPRL